MPEKAKCELVMIVDANGDYGAGKDFESAKDNYENNIGETGVMRGRFPRRGGLPWPSRSPKSSSLSAKRRKQSGKATLAVAG